MNRTWYMIWWSQKNTFGPASVLEGRKQTEIDQLTLPEDLAFGWGKIKEKNVHTTAKLVFVKVSTEGKE